MQPTAILFLFSATFALAKPLPRADETLHVVVRQAPENPCAEVAALVNSDGNKERIVPVSLAYACLNDIPLDVDGSIEWLQTLRPFIEFQTTLAYLKNPTADYLLPPVDILGQLDAFIAGIPQGMFANQYTLEYAVLDLLAQAHDSHLGYYTNLGAKLFSFARPVQLTSISVDGFTPLPYVYTDILALAEGASFEPSSVVTIDGEDAIAFLEAYLLNGFCCQDPDALYNQLFHNLASSILPESAVSGTGVFSAAAAVVYPGENTTLGFANGTERVFENIAVANLNFTNITSAADVYEVYINPSPPATMTSAPSSSSSAVPTSEVATSEAVTTSAAATESATPTQVPKPGYPEPVLTLPENQVSGYYLDSTEDLYSSVAILSIPTFESIAAGVAQEYQDLIYEFLGNASSTDGKSRLIIDLTANGGGDVYQGYSLFLNLFPDLSPYQLNRRPGIPAINAMGTIISKYVKPYPFNVTKAEEEENGAFLSLAGNLNFREDETADLQPFTSWPEKFGPHTYNGANFTSNFVLNLSDTTIPDTNSLEVNTVGSREGLPPSRPFPDPNNIILLTDGQCGSTCSIFADLMTEVAGVKIVVAGGRPNVGPMAGVGGTRGTNRWDFKNIYRYAGAAQTLVEENGELDEDIQILIDGGVDQLIDGYRLVTRRSAGVAAVNSRDLIRQDDVESGIPAQFTYQAAECRIWYTAASVVDVTALWTDVVDVTWGNGTCAYGSIQGQGWQNWKE